MHYTKLFKFLIALALLFCGLSSYAQSTRKVSGTVFDDTDEPMPGVFVYDASDKKGGTMTDGDGKYSITVSSSCKSLTFEVMGFKTKIVPVGEASSVTLEMDSERLEEVVVTGIYTRKAESFTGAVQSVTSEDLKRISNANVFQSLSSLDPALMVFDNLAAGSDPNAMASMQLRGASSFADESSDMQNPNTPLFILDGFETKLEKIKDLDMNRIESITILKDASAKAIYGAKAGNGVIVIETKSLRSDQTAVNYYGSVEVSMPDLTSYNLCNALEKLDVENREGYYQAAGGSSMMQALMSNLYYQRQKRALEGESTYWLSKPLRTGVSNKHTLEVELGGKDLKTLATLSYNNVQGAMKGSYRNTISGDISTSYRRGMWQFRNIMSITSMNSEDSPYGSFSTYSILNPYFSPYDENGNLRRILSDPFVGEGNETALIVVGYGDQFANPLYNATINTKDAEEYLEFSDNMYVEMQMFEFLKLVGRFGITAKRGQMEEFRPSDHTDYYGSASNDEALARRGRYDMENSQNNTFSGDISAQFNKNFNDAHDIFATAQYNIDQSTGSNVRHYTEGFPNSRMNDITFARQYATDKTPTGNSSLSRSLGALLTVGYSYKDRYMFDGTIKASASSVFGTNNRWGTFWSAGVAWNAHNEDFLAGAAWLRQLKFRGSVGTSGNQNYAATMSIPIYKYFNNAYYNSFTGTTLTNMGNPNLGWESKMDWNVGLDFRTQRLSLITNFYISDTRNLVFQRSILPSTGFAAVQDNMGRVRNKGIEASGNYRFYQKGSSYMAIFASIAHNNNRVLEISDALRAYNEQQQQNATESGSTKPVIQYYDGVPMHSIWVVPSLGIDPVSGKEIFVDRNGNLTNVWNAADLVNYGSSDPLFNGSAGLNGEVKGVGLNVNVSFYGGGYDYNNTLVDKVENTNIMDNLDRRVFSGRWYYPGQEAQYRNGQNGKTQATSRFVQPNNVAKLSSVSLYYEFPLELIQKIKMQRLRVTLYANDLLTLSSIKVERGTNYPYARSFTLSINATF